MYVKKLLARALHFRTAFLPKVMLVGDLGRSVIKIESALPADRIMDIIILLQIVRIHYVRMHPSPFRTVDNGFNKSAIVARGSFHTADEVSSINVVLEVGHPQAPIRRLKVIAFLYITRIMHINRLNRYTDWVPFSNQTAPRGSEQQLIQSGSRPRSH